MRQAGGRGRGLAAIVDGCLQDTTVSSGCINRRHFGTIFLLGSTVTAAEALAQPRGETAAERTTGTLAGYPVLDQLGLAMIDYMWRVPGATPLECARAALRAIVTSQFQLDTRAASFLSAPEAQLALVPQAMSRVITATGPVQRANAYKGLQSILLSKAHGLADAASWWLPMAGAGVVGLDYVEQLLHIDAAGLATGGIEFSSLPNGRRRIVVLHSMKRVEDRSGGDRRTVFTLPVDNLEEAAIAFRDRAAVQAYMQVEVDAAAVCSAPKQAMKSLRLKATQLSLTHGGDDVLIEWPLLTSGSQGCMQAAKISTRT